MQVRKFNLLRWLAIFFILIALILLVIEIIKFSRMRAGFSAGTLIAGIPVGGLDQQEAANRITQAYNVPIEITYGEETFQVKPAQLGFELNVTSMIAAADQQRVTLPFWSSLWDYLWNRPFQTIEIPLQADVDENLVRKYLSSEVASRYDEPPMPSIPVPGTINFQYGLPGKVLNIERSIPQINNGLLSPTQRNIALIVENVVPPRPSLDNLEVLLKQIIDRSGFDGLTEIYIKDLEKREEINFAYEQGVDINPGIAFTAASTIKIPIMVSTFKNLEDPTTQNAADLMQQMIDKSENPPADTLMETYLDPTLGPLFVTQDMKALGLENTFLAGHFYLGAPLLQRFSTPANQRFDYATDPDVYNQTTSSDMGMLLDDIYQCAQTGGGTFPAVFGDGISQSECQLMVTYLIQNKIAVLLQAGLPDGTNFAHKHGWIVENDGLIHTMLDTGIVFSPNANYIVTVVMYQPTQLIFDVANILFAQLSTSIYNYFNIS